MTLTAAGSGPVDEAQRRLLLVLRSQHGPRTPELWSSVCSAARAVSTGCLSLEELERVADALVARGGTDAVAARSCRVRLLFARRAAGGSRVAVPRPVPLPRDPYPAEPALDDDAVRAAFAEPEALEQDAWQQRLAELEAELGDD